MPLSCLMMRIASLDAFMRRQVKMSVSRTADRHAIVETIGLHKCTAGMTAVFFPGSIRLVQSADLHGIRAAIRVEALLDQAELHPVGNKTKNRFFTIGVRHQQIDTR